MHKDYINRIKIARVVKSKLIKTIKVVKWCLLVCLDKMLRNVAPFQFWIVFPDKFDRTDIPYTQSGLCI